MKRQQTRSETKMDRYEIRLLDESGRVSAVYEHECATLEEAINVGRRLITGQTWVEVWFEAQVLAKFSAF